MSASPGGSELVAVARALAASGLVDAFGHVSVRDGESALITPASPMSAVSSPEQLVELPLGELDELPAGAPKEAWVHWAIYRARADVGAICRAQPPSPLAVAAVADELPAVLGQGAIAGAPVPVYPDSRLVREPGRAVELAASLGDSASLIMRGNGALTTASTPGRATGPHGPARALRRHLAAGRRRRHPAPPQRRGSRRLASRRRGAARAPLAAPARLALCTSPF